MDDLGETLLGGDRVETHVGEDGLRTGDRACVSTTSRQRVAQPFWLEDAMASVSSTLRKPRLVPLGISFFRDGSACQNWTVLLVLAVMCGTGQLVRSLGR